MSETTTTELMKFMSEFRQSMEEKIKDTNLNLEDKIKNMDDKLDGKMLEMEKKIETNMEKVETGMSKLNSKIDRNERREKQTADRMEKRMNDLELEMKKSESIRKKTEMLKEKQAELPFHPERSEEQLNQPSRNKKFSRRKITQDDLAVESTGSLFHSDWAQQVAKDLETAAGMDRGTKKPSEERDNTNHIRGEKEIEKRKEAHICDWYENKGNKIQWEALEPATRKKIIRKPAIITHWFGDEESSASESDASTMESTGWTEIERKKECERKKKKNKLKKKRKEEETSQKAMMMLGIGPITENELRRLEDMIGDKEGARVRAIKDLLDYHLDFNNEELRDLGIIETQEGKDSIVYFAAGNKELLTEIHKRKAESRNDEVELRNFIPPQMYSRYISLNKICTERRQQNKDLKTQLRFGMRDVEVFTKTKGSGEGFKKVELNDFLGDNYIPPYDHNIKWKRKEDRKVRRIPKYRNTAKSSEEPAVRNVSWEKTSLVRQRSLQEDSEVKRARIENSVKIVDMITSDNDDDENDAEGSGSGSETEEDYETPKADKKRHSEDEHEQ